MSGLNETTAERAIDGFHYRRTDHTHGVLESKANPRRLGTGEDSARCREVMHYI